jgi:hypothetical protein
MLLAAQFIHSLIRKYGKHILQHICVLYKSTYDTNLIRLAGDIQIDNDLRQYVGPECPIKYSE